MSTLHVHLHCLASNLVLLRLARNERILLQNVLDLLHVHVHSPVLHERLPQRLTRLVVVRGEGHRNMRVQIRAHRRVHLHLVDIELQNRKLKLKRVVDEDERDLIQNHIRHDAHHVLLRCLLLDNFLLLHLLRLLG